MNIGYARVSTGLQNLDLQKDSLEKYNCEKIFTNGSVAKFSIKNKIPYGIYDLSWDSQ